MLRRKPPKQRARRLRNPKHTRKRLLKAAFQEVYRSGFQSASLDAILAATGVTKGALYYHFEGKEALGLAVVEEVIAEQNRDKWLRPLRSGGEPIETLISIVRGTLVSARSCTGRLSSEQPGSGDVSVGRKVPQALGEGISSLAGRHRDRFAERADPRDGPPRPGP